MVPKPDRDSRFVPIEGSLNFRDFGGYATAGGGLVKRGKLFRCGSLANIPEQAHQDFANLDIGVICDLRRDEESRMSPTPDAAPFECRVHIPIDPGSSTQLHDSYQNPNHDSVNRIQFMESITREIARDHIQEYRNLFDQLLAVNNGFLLHCSAGKDRTGFGAAMILFALGVSETDVFFDYLLSNRATELFERMKPMFKKQYGNRVDDESLRVISGVKESYLRAALDQVRQQHGSIDGYLNAVGVDQAARETLRSRLVA